MCRFHLRKLIAFFLACAMLSASGVSAQENTASELTNLWRRLQRTQDAEERISLSKQGLALDAQLEQCPLSIAQNARCFCQPKPLRRPWWSSLGPFKAQPGVPGLDRSVSVIDGRGPT